MNSRSSLDSGRIWVLRHDQVKQAVAAIHFRFLKIEQRQSRTA
jgi:hypothetical protein